MALTTITVTARYPDAALVATAGTVTFVPPGRLLAASDSEIIAPVPVTITLDEDGELSVDLVCTDNPDLNPINWTYAVIERIPGRQAVRYNIALPASLGSTVDLSRLSPVTSSTGTPIIVGPTGPPGPATLTVVAGTDLSGHRVVRPQLDATVIYASNDDVTDATRPMWLTLDAALDGADVTVQTFGAVTDPSWAWVYGPIFLGSNGVLTQTPPTTPAAFIEQVASPVGPTGLFWNPRSAVLLG